MPDDNETPTEAEPALTRTVAAGIASGVLLLVLGRFNRATHFLDGGELDQAKALVALIAPVVAGLLIRARVVPAQRADRAAKFFMAAGYAQGVDDGGTAPVSPDVADAIIAEHEQSKRDERNARRRAARWG